MKNHTVPDFNGLAITESRNYEMPFDEPVNVYNSRYGGVFYFVLAFDFSTLTGSVRIPDCGGLVDGVPSSFLQQEWTAATLQGLSARQTWATSWEVRGRESHASFIGALRAGGASLKSLSYASGMPGVRTVLAHAAREGMAIGYILIRDGGGALFGIDDGKNSRLRELAFMDGVALHDYCRILGEILETDRIGADGILEVSLRTDT